MTTTTITDLSGFDFGETINKLFHAIEDGIKLPSELDVAWEDPSFGHSLGFERLPLEPSYDGDIAFEGVFIINTNFDINLKNDIIQDLLMNGKYLLSTDYSKIDFNLYPTINKRDGNRYHICLEWELIEYRFKRGYYNRAY